LTGEAGVRLNAVEKDRVFRGLLLASLDDVIREVLGERPLKAMFSSLESNFHIKREEIPERLEDFQKGLAELFGKGAPVITRAVTRRLCRRLGIPYYERRDYDFKMYVEDCKRRYEQGPAMTRMTEGSRQGR
jgi:hypothetical protein